MTSRSAGSTAAAIRRAAWACLARRAYATRRAGNGIRIAGAGMKLRLERSMFWYSQGILKRGSRALAVLPRTEDEPVPDPECADTGGYSAADCCAEPAPGARPGRGGQSHP